MTVGSKPKEVHWQPVRWNVFLLLVYRPLQPSMSYVGYYRGRVRNMTVIDFIVNVLITPAILVDALSLLGLVLQKKPIEELVKEL